MTGRPGGVHRPLVGARLDGAEGADHADPPVAGGGHHGPHARVDDADDGHVALEAEQLEGGRGGGVAGHDHHLHVVPLDQPRRDLGGVAPHLVERLGPVRVAAGVAEVDEVLLGQQVDEGPGHGEAPEPAVEHPDRPVVHVLEARPTYRWRPAMPIGAHATTRACALLPARVRPGRLWRHRPHGNRGRRRPLHPPAGRGIGSGGRGGGGTHRGARVPGRRGAGRGAHASRGATAAARPEHAHSGAGDRPGVAAVPRGGCDPSYPGVCIPPGPPDLDCGDITHRRFAVLAPDPHRFDGEGDGIGCEML